MAEPGFVLDRLRPLAGLTLAWRRWFDTRAVPLPGGPDREADLVAVADEEEGAKRAWLLVFEVQSEHDEEKPRVLQLEALLFLVYARDADREGAPFLPLPVFVYLKGDCPGAAVSVRTPTECGFTGKPVVWEAGKDSAAQALDGVESGESSWGALFWVPLMKGAAEDGTVARWRRLVDEKVPAKSRADVAVVAGCFAELAGCSVAWNRVMGDVQMTESALANSLIERGAMREARKNLLRFLRARLPEALTPDVERAIADQPSLPLLDQWLDAAVTAQTVDEFLAVLRR